MNEDITKQMQSILNDYATEVRKTVDETCLDVARESASKTKEASAIYRDTGKYQKGWMVTEVATGGYGASTYVVHNKAKPGLTHLLENGHAKRGGGRWTPPKKHIKPVDEWVQNELPKLLTRKLGGI